MADLVEVKVPDIGDYKDVPVIEVFVKPGDEVKPEDSLITVESDKATMDVPSPAQGVVKELRVKVGDKVSQGSLVLVLEPAAGKGAEKPAAAPQADAPKAAAASKSAPALQADAVQQADAAPAPTKSQPPAQRSAQAPARESREIDEAAFAKVHASPSVRRLAREFGIDLSKVRGTGPKGRILQEDIQAYVKAELARPSEAQGGAGLGFNLPPLQPVDFSKFGPVEAKPLSRIKKLSGAFLHRNWLSIPHVTQHEEADITELEAFRKAQSEEAKAQGIRFTILGFLMKASVVALKQFPDFNASLSPDGESLVVKHYTHIGFAADTPQGLVVPVIRDADKKDLYEIAKALATLSERARTGKLQSDDIQGGVFTISSLGGIGGRFFTPIINAPEVAILGVSRSIWQPVYRDLAFVPRLTLPLSLSYDHRVIDGAKAVRFTARLGEILANPGQLVEAIP